MEKKQFEEPEMEVVRFDLREIIITGSCYVDGCYGHEEIEDD